MREWVKEATECPFLMFLLLVAHPQSGKQLKIIFQDTLISKATFVLMVDATENYLLDQAKQPSRDRLILPKFAKSGQENSQNFEGFNAVPLSVLDQSRVVHCSVGYHDSPTGCDWALWWPFFCPVRGQVWSNKVEKISMACGAVG